MSLALHKNFFLAGKFDPKDGDKLQVGKSKVNPNPPTVCEEPNNYVSSKLLHVLVPFPPP